jgi:hypothetical protein
VSTSGSDLCSGYTQATLLHHHRHPQPTTTNRYVVAYRPLYCITTAIHNHHPPSARHHPNHEPPTTNNHHHHRSSHTHDPLSARKQESVLNHEGPPRSKHLHFCAIREHLSSDDVAATAQCEKVADERRRLSWQCRVSAYAQAESSARTVTCHVARDHDDGVVFRIGKDA